MIINLYLHSANLYVSYDCTVSISSTGGRSDKQTGICVYVIL